MASGLSIEVDGLMETIQSTRQIQDAFERKETNKQLRGAAKTCATRLAADLTRAASASGVPVAPRVARSIKVKSDRIPVVSIGGSAKVGRSGGSAAALVWGSEQGPKGEVNHFGVPPSGGYWIAPTVERFQGSQAISEFQRAVVDIFREHGLL